MTGSISYFALLSSPLLCITCIVVNIFMMEIIISSWFPPIGLISFFTAFARYTEVVHTHYWLLHALMCVCSPSEKCLSIIVSLFSINNPLTVVAMVSTDNLTDTAFILLRCFSCVVICCAYLKPLSSWSVCPTWECLISCLFLIYSPVCQKFEP